MASGHIENKHVAKLDQLMEDADLQCDRQSTKTSSSSSSETMAEEFYMYESPILSKDMYGELQSEGVSEGTEEQSDGHSTLKHETSAGVFPTESLRRCIDDKTRHLQAENVIHVLPSMFATEIDPENIPVISKTSPDKYIEILADLTGCTLYKNSLAEFWFLDTLASLLQRAQQDRLDKNSQAVLILWFIEWMKEMQYYDAADRHRMLKRFKENMLAAASYISEENRIPAPQHLGIEPAIKSSTKTRIETPMEVESNIDVLANYKCSMNDLIKIIHYIYDLFSTDFQYELVRSVFTFPPDYIPIDSPYQMHYPKKLYAPPKAKKDSAKDSASAKKKQQANLPVASVSEILPEEYLELMKLKEKEQAELKLREEKYMEECQLKNSILPLGMAVNEEFFYEYWPPPEPPTPVEVSPTPVGKGKKKK